MALVTQPLRDEHRELLPEVEVLRKAGDGIDTPAAPDLIGRALTFLTGHLIPHAQAEDAALYPVVGRVLGDDRTTDTMRRDHVEVEALTHALATLAGRWTGTPEEQMEARRLLYGLYALVKVHFAKEEEVYLPILDGALSMGEAGVMFEAMEAAAVEAKARAKA